MKNVFKNHPKRACIAIEVAGILGYVLNPITTLSTLQIVLFSVGSWILYKCVIRGAMHFAESVELCIIALIFFILGGFNHNPAEAVGSLLILGLLAMLALYLRRQGTKNKH